MASVRKPGRFRSTNGMTQETQWRSNGEGSARGSER
jgi:hypothetical protein